jgi:hypothetical protein
MENSAGQYGNLIYAANTHAAETVFQIKPPRLNIFRYFAAIELFAAQSNPAVLSGWIPPR